MMSFHEVRPQNAIDLTGPVLFELGIEVGYIHQEKAVVLELSITDRESGRCPD